MNGDLQLEALVFPENFYYSDPLDATGRRCDAACEGIGVCDRRYDHAEKGDPWHHAITDVGDSIRNATHWRWKYRDADGG